MKRLIFTFLLLASHASAYKYDLALCAIFQNEAPYLKEWIEFHRLVGVECFYLYNNNSTDNYQEVLKPYIDKGILKLTDWPFTAGPDGSWNTIQCDAYKDCIIRVQEKVKWLAIIDTDEFLFPVQTDSLVDFLADFEDYGAVAANWVMYGTSYVPKIPDGSLLIEALHLRASSANPHIKSIVRPDCVSMKKFYNPHSFPLRKGYKQVNSEKVAFKGPASSYPIIDKIRVNHYWTRDEYYLFNVKVPRRLSFGDSSASNPAVINEMNIVHDEAIFKYVNRLKRKMV